MGPSCDRLADRLGKSMTAEIPVRAGEKIL